MTTSPAARGTYRHGSLRDALVDAGLGMARAGGPDAVVLREATRVAGVSPNAAYRHFADRTALVLAVSSAAQSRAADRMEEELERVEQRADAVALSRARLRAVGVGYLGFAREEPGLFRVAFSVPDDLSNAFSPAKAGRRGRSPFQVLADTLDEMVTAGSLDPSRRPGAELLAWSTVHGLGMLVIEGPLRGLDPAAIDATTQRAIDMVERGI